MKNRWLKPVVAAALVLCTGVAPAQVQPAAKSQLESLMRKVDGKLKSGQRSESDLAEELKAFDALLEQSRGQNSEAASQILLMKAMLYLNVFKQNEKGLEILKQIKQDFPASTQSKKLDDLIPMVEKQVVAQKLENSLNEGATLPDFEAVDLDGKPLSIAKYQGSVVLLSFWAVSCTNSVAELPSMLESYKRYHRKGFEIIGISLDKDRKALVEFLENRGVTWSQCFDGKGAHGNLALQYGVKNTPATFLLDGAGKIVARNLDGKALVGHLARLLGE